MRVNVSMAFDFLHLCGDEDGICERFLCNMLETGMLEVMEKVLRLSVLGHGGKRQRFEVVMAFTIDVDHKPAQKNELAVFSHPCVSAVGDILKHLLNDIEGLVSELGLYTVRVQLS